MVIEFEVLVIVLGVLWVVDGLVVLVVIVFVFGCYVFEGGHLRRELFGGTTGEPMAAREPSRQTTKGRRRR